MAMEVVSEPSSVVGAEENGHHDIHNDRDIHDDHDQDEEDPIVPRRSSRARVKTQFYGQLVNAVMLNEPDEPANYKDAMEGLMASRPSLVTPSGRFEMQCSSKFPSVKIPRLSNQ